MNRLRLSVLAFSLVFLGVGVSAIAQKPSRKQPDKKQPMRVKPKPYDPAEVRRVFFEDVFAVLVGERPKPQTEAEFAANSNSANPNSANPSSTPSSAPMPTATSGTSWSQTVSATTIEDEIKALKPLLDQDITTPGDFKNRGYKECRRHFTLGAVLFAVITEFEGEVRWKESAPAARDIFAHSAEISKVGSSQVFDEAKKVKADLEDLLNGSVLPNAKEANPQNEWGNVAFRQPLMKRLEMAFEGQVQKFTANEAEFKSNKDALVHEAEIIAMISEALTKPGTEDGEDTSYMEFAQKMKAAARATVEGASKGDYEAARKSAGDIGQACSLCHEAFRG